MSNWRDWYFEVLRVIFLFLARRILALHWDVAKTIEQKGCNKSIFLDKEQKKQPPKGTQTSAEFNL